MKRIVIVLFFAMLLVGCVPGGGAETETALSAKPGATLGPPDPSAVPVQKEPAQTLPETAPVETLPPETMPVQTEAPETIPVETAPVQTVPETEPVETAPVQTQPVATQPETVPETTAAPQTQAPTTESAGPALPTEAFKRQVEYYAAQYINEYRGLSGVPTCQVLPGMTQVAQMRASQLTYNFSHSTADKRAALAYYQYGRWIDATEFGGDPEDSYYEADSAEAICAGFRGVEAEAMGKRIADMIYGSPSHWSYVGSSEYSYIAVGVEYRAGTAYDWYGCVMVGKVNYG